jgi:hypothetical protein
MPTKDPKSRRPFVGYQVGEQNSHPTKTFIIPIVKKHVRALKQYGIDMQSAVSCFGQTHCISFGW